MATRPIVVVTGASGGVGRATARAFADAGYDVALLARGMAGLEGAATDVIGMGVVGIARRFWGVLQNRLLAGNLIQGTVLWEIGQVDQNLLRDVLEVFGVIG